MDGSWQRHPAALSPRRDTSRVEPSGIVSLGAICSISPVQTPQPNTHSFLVGEFVDLEDGRRVELHEERGFTISEWRSVTPGDQRDTVLRDTTETLRQNVLMVVLPDDNRSTELHPWSWLAELASTRGLDVTADDLKALPYTVVFHEDVLKWLAETQ